MIEVIQDYGFTTVFVWLMFHFWYRYISDKLDLQKVDDPKNHNFFYNIEKHIRTTSHRIQSYYWWKYCDGRSKLIRKLLNVKLTVRKKHFKDLIENLDHSNSKENIKSKVWMCLIELIEDYENKRKLDWIPKVVIEQFNDWHKRHCEIFMHNIESLCSSNCFSSSKEMLNAILILSNWLLIQTILDAEETLWHLNGELSHLEIKIDGENLVLE